MSGEFKLEEYKIEEKGKAFFELAKKENLEGIVAKKKVCYIIRFLFPRVKS